MNFLERGIDTVFAKKILPNKVLILLGAMVNQIYGAISKA